MPAVESLGLAVLKWVASPVIKDLVKKSIAYLGNNIAEGLEDLETTLLPQFQLTIQAAENSRHKDWVAEWLLRLKNAYYDAEGILHALEYKHLRRKARGKQSKIWVRISSYPIIKPLAKYTGKINKKVSLLSPQKRKLINQLNKLKKIAAEAKRLRELLRSTETRNEIGTTSDNSPPVIGSQLPHKVFGRGYERDEIINFLLFDKKEKGNNNSSSSPNTRSYPVVAITGIGGAGKTTLAQYVYDDESVKQHFSARMWICLSKKKDAQDRTKEMIECITKKRSDLDNLSELQNILKDALLLQPKQVLLVLDNFWAHDTEDAENERWKNLLVPFNYIKDRFKILATSRANKFPISLIPAKLIQLHNLEDDYFLELFRYYAGLEISNSQLQNDFYDEIANKIVCKLSRSPLAARAVGDRLYKNRDKRFWLDTERNVDLTDTRKVLLWSFQLMDVPIQRCFLFCGVFSRNTWHTGYDLVQYWIALDFIQSSDASKRVEDVGSDYFQMMVESSIFQFVNGRYYMHDLYYDLVEQLSVEDCFRVENGQRDQIPSTTLHLYLNADDGNLNENLSSICNLCNLRTLILETYFIDDLNDIFSVIGKYCKNLRVLDVWSDSYKIVPSVVGLKNLRYLNVWDPESSIQELPDSVLQLYHLQFLILPSSVITLPTKLADLIKLRNVGKYDTNFNHVGSLPPVPYLGKLTSLQHLDEFHVRREEGYGLEQLGCLREIGGTLRIVNLENVRNEDEAVVARLIEKPKLDGLELVWAESADNIGSEFEVINALQPPPSLETLTIDGYSGSRCPTWLHEGSTIQILASIRLLNCNALTILPLNLHQFCCCSELVLDNLGALKELPSFPGNLARLQISKCPCLILVSENELQVNENQGIMETQHLVFNVSKEELLAHELASFKQTGSMQNCMEQLQIIESTVGGNHSPELWRNISRAWWRCHQQRLNFIFRGTTRSNILKSLPLSIQNLHLSYLCLSDGELLEFLKGMTNLENLYLEGIMTITTLPSADVLQSLQSLRDLRIYDCWCLRSLSDLHALPQLQKIDIIYCPEISGLPELPSSVQHIEISGCPVLTELCQPNGPEWHKIQHIKNKWID